MKVHAPSSLKPDLYFLGFIVTPIPDPTTGVTVINQIGGFFTIDIPGPRDRRLAADLDLPGWSILGLHVFVGSDLRGTLHVHNIGQAAVRFWGETDTTTTGGSPGQMRIPRGGPKSRFAPELVLPLPSDDAVRALCVRASARTTARGWTL